MADAIDAICADLGIRFIQTKEPGGPLLTKAGSTVRAIGLEHGNDHVLAVLRTFTESTGNELALTAPCICAVSDIIAANPGWLRLGARWIDAFDGIDLLAMMEFTKKNRDAVPKRQAIATMLHARLAAIFDPPAPVDGRLRFAPPQYIARAA